MDRIPLYYTSRTHFLRILSEDNHVVVAVEAEYSVTLKANPQLSGQLRNQLVRQQEATQLIQILRQI